MPFDFQRKAWEAYQSGKSGLVHAPTGIGKTYAAFGGPVLEALKDGTGQGKRSSGLQVLWITPLRALANDTADALSRMLEAVGLNWAVGIRHGDVSSATRQRQRRRLPEVLVTTPESLTVLLSYPDAAGKFAGLRCIVCDEWHELIGNKRGIQAELALARLRAIEPPVRTWGLSATIGNLHDALDVLVGDSGVPTELITGKHQKIIEIETLLPETIEQFPWAGHLGIRLVPQVIEQIKKARTTLVFTNTRSQTEIWYQSILKAAPELEGKLAVHHGSLNRDVRQAVEAQLDAGELQAVVCTSSLDLGVDFSPVEQVIQVGSPKGIARLTQRAGRSGHQPGAVSKIYGVPTNALEIMEFAAAREAVQRGEIEDRPTLRNPLDVLLQHVITLSLTGALTEEQLYREVKATAAYRSLSEEDWQWVLGFAKGTVGALQAYPEYQKVKIVEGRLTVPENRHIKMHRMSIGTITSDSEVTVKLIKGPSLGQIEERFVSRMKPGHRFTFAGRVVELVRFSSMTAYVKKASRKAGETPAWAGGRSPLSSELALAVSREIANAAKPDVDPLTLPVEMQRIGSLLALQRQRSQLPGRDYLLVEQCRYKRTSNIFFYPFAGRLVHEGLAALTAFRLTRELPLTLRTTVNDYGFSLQSAKQFELTHEQLRAMLSPDNLTEDLLECMNTTELARRQFREISRIAGLVFQGYPGQQKTVRNLQMSSGLLYDVFVKYDPDNRLVWQAKAELLERQLEQTRLLATLKEIANLEMHLQTIKTLTPFAFPLWAESLHEQVTSESWADRVAVFAEELERD